MVSAEKKLINLFIVSNLILVVTYILYKRNPKVWFFVDYYMAMGIVYFLQFIYNRIFKK